MHDVLVEVKFWQSLGDVLAYLAYEGMVLACVVI